RNVTGAETCALPILASSRAPGRPVGSCTAHPVLRDGPLEAVRLIPCSGTARWKLYGSSRASGRPVRSCTAHPALRDGPLEAVWTSVKILDTLNQDDAIFSADFS